MQTITSTFPSIARAPSVFSKLILLANPLSAPSHAHPNIFFFKCFITLSTGTGFLGFTVFLQMPLIFSCRLVHIVTIWISTCIRFVRMNIFMSLKDILLVELFATAITHKSGGLMVSYMSIRRIPGRVTASAFTELT